MSTAEPIMPPHKLPDPPTVEHDLDHDADVLFDVGDNADVETADAQPWHQDDAPPTLPRPVPGAQLTPDQLAADLDPE
ncbi:hypothetical protein JNB62_08875 [Microbacterium jejuense]|uniref:Uncharacterized protein n=1 Tax=Microbacterium jejuense TaxID=1263637 RepID=A0ABS7HM91_9MICO|nr:hypothetical protein [Microbacterium jejuense]MBW9093793.1 hypothetical protein [Microbacterium jejuense]